MTSEYVSSDAFLETLFDMNSDMLIDLHEEVKDRYYLSGIMMYSKSSDFIQCILDSIVIQKNKAIIVQPPLVNTVSDEY